MPIDSGSIGAEVFDPGPARQKHEIEILRLDGGQRRIRMGRDAAAAGGVAVLAEGRDRDLDPGAAQPVGHGGELGVFLFFQKAT